MRSATDAVRASWARLWTRRKRTQTLPDDTANATRPGWRDRVPTNGILALSALVIWSAVYVVYIR